MSKIIAMPKNKKHLETLLNLNINAILLSLENLAVNMSYPISLDRLKRLVPQIKKKNKQVFISLNKIMHNHDIEMLTQTLKVLKELNVDKIIFYDLSLIPLAEKLNITDKLVIAQEHSNASIESHNFYNSYGINTSLITSDITIEEVKEIKKQTKMELIIPVYGHIPIMYSRRYLITNYLNHIHKKKESDYYYFKQNEDTYIIQEEPYGTAIYNGKILNLDKEYQENQSFFDYVILYSNFIDETTYNKTIKNYLNIDSINNFEKTYKGFAYTKTIYKVKKDE